MIVKGGSRAGASDLAAHLARSDTNERATVRELRGVAADDLAGALAEMQARVVLTRGRLGLYHASLNPAPGERLSAQDWTRALDILEQRLGFQGQARAVVMHTKAGREHMHVVWSRVDLERGRLVRDGWNYIAHEDAARQIERELALRRVPGVHAEREGERPPRTPSRAEMAAAERSGIDPRDVNAALSGAWSETRTGEQFWKALESMGFVLARGDRRDFVVIDHMGELHSLRRRIDGAKAADIKARMADLDPASLPGIEEARAMLRERDEVAKNDKGALTELPCGQFLQRSDPPPLPAPQAMFNRAAERPPPRPGLREHIREWMGAAGLSHVTEPISRTLFRVSGSLAAIGQAVGQWVGHLFSPQPIPARMERERFRRYRGRGLGL